jgi:hypothetical protein
MWQCRLGVAQRKQNAGRTKQFRVRTSGDLPPARQRRPMIGNRATAETTAPAIDAARVNAF